MPFLLLLFRLHPLGRRLAGWVSGAAGFVALIGLADADPARPAAPAQSPDAVARIAPPTAVTGPAVSTTGVASACGEGTVAIGATARGETSRNEVHTVTPNTDPEITAVEPGTRPVRRVTVQSPWGFAWTWRHHTLPLTALAEDELGRELAEGPVTWRAVNPEVASLVPTGARDVAVHGGSVGETDVEAVVDGVCAHRMVRVHEVPNGAIVYEAGEGEDRHLMLWDVAAGDAPRRWHTPMAACAPSPSPDGREVAFVAVATSEGGDAELFIASRDGRTRRVAPGAGVVGDPAWSPDGSRLAFTGASAGGGGDVFVMQLATGVVARLTDADPRGDRPGSGAGARSPAWSPDGTRIAYAVRSSAGSHLWVMAPDGSGKRCLTDGADANDFDPAWSPDGATIAFRRQFRQPQHSVLMTVTPDGRGVSSIGGRVVTVAATPAYSPDGRWLTTAQTRGSGMGALYAFSIVANAGPRIVMPTSLGGGRHARWMVRA